MFAAEMGVGPDQFKVDPEAIKASLGIVDDTVDTITYRDLQERRELIRRRLERR
jgi:ubiquinone biosynthesis protein